MTHWNGCEEVCSMERLCVSTTIASDRYSLPIVGHHFLVITIPTARRGPLWVIIVAARKKGRHLACPQSCPSGLAVVSGVKGGRRPSRSDCAATLEAGGASPYGARPPKAPHAERPCFSASAALFLVLCASALLLRGGGRKVWKEGAAEPLFPPGGWPRLQPATASSDAHRRCTA